MAKLGVLLCVFFSLERRFTLQRPPTIRDLICQQSEPALALIVASSECCFWAVGDLEQVTADTQQLICQHTDLQCCDKD